MSQVGRISGPLLQANLERNGIDLAFRNTSGATQLLYLDVSTGRIGVNKSVPMYELDVDSTIHTTNIISNAADIDLLQISTNNINNLIGDININAPEIIKISTLATDNLKINDNIISSYNTNSNIDLVPNGTGRVIVGADDSAGDLALNVQGNLHATGNITYEGNITFGDNINQDTVTFEADIDSDILPDGNNTRQLGSPTKRWLLMEAQSINNEIFNANTVNANGAVLVKRTGNIFYVAENGSDTNVGDHPSGPFKTIKHALSASDASTGGPVTIYVYPGGYEEELPLVVPTNVSVIGADMRNCFIRPTSADLDKDVFHLNGESSIQNLTITDFYYDSGTNTGHAFRFAPNTVVSSRSPYIQNVTVITKGTTTSASDPRGFASGDAGKGALIDGASVNSASQEASMLFHSCTFITPGVDAITMTNGVRVEWLNSFTYFANRGLYAVRGTTGHLSTDGSTTQFGAEIRSIGSANVYGNFGAVADGADTLMYLIQHNFAYIGLGKFLDNDNSRVVQTQEVTELNSGKIYYQSVDQLGNFRVGDNFFIDQEAGETTLTLTEAQVDSLSGLNITTGGNTTIVNGDFVETGNLRIDDNELLSTIGNVTVSAANNTINLLKNTNISKDLSVVGNLTFDGNLNLLGNQTTDILNLNVKFDQDINPHTDGVLSLGSPSKQWLNVEVDSTSYLGDVLFSNNIVSTFNTNADLELRASGTGEISVANNNVEVTNNLAVNGTTNLQNLITNSFVLANNFNISTNFATSNLTAENLTVGSQAQFEEINIDGNVITTTSTNADLELRANSSGRILIPNEDLTISNNLDVKGTWYASDINSSTQITATQFDNNTINVNNNIITTDISHADLELRATGDVKLNDSVQVTNDIEITGTTNILNSSITGSITHIGASNQTGNKTINGNTTVTGDLELDQSVQFEEVLFDDNVITTTSTNADLELRASGTGSIIIPQANVSITKDLSLGTLNAGTININNEFELENMVSSTDIEIFDNVITTTNTNSNLELRASGTGSVILENINFNTNVIGSTVDNITFDTDNIDLNIDTALVLPKGTTAERLTGTSSTLDGGSASVTGTLLDGGSASTVFTLSDTVYDGEGSLSTTVGVQGDIRFNTDDNVFEGTGTNIVTFGGVYSSDRQTSVTADPKSDNLRFIIAGAETPLDSTTLVAEIAGDTLSVHSVQTDDINIDNNVIKTNVTNSDLELKPNGTGTVKTGNIEVKGNNITNIVSGDTLKIASTGLGYPKFSGTGAIKVPAGNTAERPTSPVLGQTRHNTDTNILETWTGTQWQNSAGEFDAVSEAEMDDLSLMMSLIYG